MVFWKYSLAKICGNSITGFFSGFATSTLFDSDLITKVLNSLFGVAVVSGIAIGKLVGEYGDRKKAQAN